MPYTHSPRKGSLQFWHRKRAKSETARVRHWPGLAEAKPAGFAGYKVGMAHVIIKEERRHARMRNEDVFVPVTIIECPPMRLFGVNFYKETDGDLKLARQLLISPDEEIKRKLIIPKKKPSLEGINPEDYSEIRALVHTQPGLTGIGKKKPEVFEVALGGSNAEKFNYIKEKMGHDISVTEVFKDTDIVDVHSVTKGRGFQGAVKRFGINLKESKSEKSRRTPGSLGSWNTQGKIMWRVAYAGKTGYNQRTEYNKMIIKVADKPDKINPEGGFHKYGIIRNSYLILRGSVAGPKKRLIRMNFGARTKRKSWMVKPEELKIKKIIVSSS